MAKLNIDLTVKVNVELKAFYEAKIKELELLVYDSYVEGLNETYDSCITEMGDELDMFRKSDAVLELARLRD